MVKIDVKDRKILYELDINSRQSIPQISKKVGLHKNAVRYRIKRLEKNGIITNYYTAIDSHKLGYMVLKFYTKYQNATSSIKREIIDYFTSNKTTWVVCSIEGAFDLDVIFWVKNLNQFYSFWQKTLNIYGKYFKDPTFLFQIQAISFRPSYLIDKDKKPQNEKFEITGSGSITQIDELDYQLLKIIASQARLSLIDIIKTLKVSSNIVRYRLKKLTKLDIIQGYRTNIDISKLGYVSVKADLFLNKHEERNKIIKYLKCNPYIVCIMTSIGYSHLEIELNVENMVHFYNIMQDVIDKFPDIIQNYQYFSILENHKLCWMPEE
ncbi:MAG: Lrp/AsnC family transcriptional regulator [Candidatus Hodarchaeota archaeon]|jgi:Lrp/AsnC family transcriptional regulator for asnA, asnC and gidA